MRVSARQQLTVDEVFGATHPRGLLNVEDVKRRCNSTFSVATNSTQKIPDRTKKTDSDMLSDARKEVWRGRDAK